MDSHKAELPGCFYSSFSSFFFSSDHQQPLQQLSGLLAGTGDGCEMTMMEKLGKDLREDKVAHVQAVLEEVGMYRLPPFGSGLAIQGCGEQVLPLYMETGGDQVLQLYVG